MKNLIETSWSHLLSIYVTFYLWQKLEGKSHHELLVGNFVVFFVYFNKEEKNIRWLFLLFLLINPLESGSNFKF